MGAFPFLGVLIVVVHGRCSFHLYFCSRFHLEFRLENPDGFRLRIQPQFRLGLDLDCQRNGKLGTQGKSLPTGAGSIVPVPVGGVNRHLGNVFPRLPVKVQEADIHMDV